MNKHKILSLVAPFTSTPTQSHFDFSYPPSNPILLTIPSTYLTHLRISAHSSKMQKKKHHLLQVVATMIYCLLILSFKNGVVLNRYMNTVTTLIPKDDGLPKIHRLRPIHIIESELQAITKSQWAKNLSNYH